MTILVTAFTWLGAIASVLCLSLLCCWLLDKTVSAVLRTIGWLGPVTRFMRLDWAEKQRIRDAFKSDRKKAERQKREREQ